MTDPSEAVTTHTLRAAVQAAFSDTKTLKDILAITDSDGLYAFAVNMARTRLCQNILMRAARNDGSVTDQYLKDVYKDICHLVDLSMLRSESLQPDDLLVFYGQDYADSVLNATKEWDKNSMGLEDALAVLQDALAKKPAT